MSSKISNKSEDLSVAAQGTVVRSTGSTYYVRLQDLRTIPCKVKGKFRRMGIRTTNPVAVGDKVTIEILRDGVAYIVAIEPRRNYIIRKASNLSKESQILAANIDHAFLVATLREPETTTTFIDRFLATAEAYSVPATLILNKCDIWTTEDSELADAVSYLYSGIGYNVIFCSTKTGIGVEEIRNKTKNKNSLFAGNSGVGKTSLINSLIPGLNLRTGVISQIHHTGMHTTTASEMYELPQGGYVIDIPGIKGFGTIDMDKAEVSHYFPEIFKISKDCRFNGCTHTHEPGCAVRQALEQHRIAQSRFTSYLSIMEDNGDSKYRKPF